ncbi:MAG: autoinducer 2 ABC transporter substrate-binding protein [Bacteroidetes bacterium]|nr:autoinducer 2 ABC transporter substrate-binding protein [Bacteroidota bacterium]
MKISKIFFVLLMLAVVVLPLLANADVEAGGKEKLYYVPKFTGFIFFELAGQGAQQACDELGVEMVTLGTTQNDVEGYVQILQNLLPQKPQIMVTTSSDANAPVPVLKKIRANGATIVTFDSDVGQEGRDLYINIAPYEVQAKAILDSALYNNPKGGKVIWLAPSPNITTFNEVKKSIDSLVSTNSKYKVLEVIDTLYMQDDPDISYSVATSAMEAYPDLSGFITSSGMANPAVNKAIQDTGRTGKVYCTGMGLPSTMETFLNDGVSKQFALWSPYWFGYMSAYVAIEIHRGNIVVGDGKVMDIPNVGERKISNTPGGMVADLDMMVFFRKGNSTFETGIPMTTAE